MGFKPGTTFRQLGIPCLLAAFVCCAAATAEPSSARLALEKGDRVVFVGNTFAERMRYYGYFETLLGWQFRDLGLTFRNLGWSADEVSLRPRPLNFGSVHTHLTRLEADVVFLFYGFNESHGGAEKLRDFNADLEALLDAMLEQQYNGTGAPRLALVSPMPQESFEWVPDVTERNAQVAAYSAAMAEVARRRQIPYVDLFGPLSEYMKRPDARRLTFNGVHMEDDGYRLVAPVMMEQLGYPVPKRLATLDATDSGWPLDAVRQLVVEKNQLFFDRWRAVNGYYIYGDRKQPFGVVSYPPEMARFDELTSGLDRQIVELSRQPQMLDDSRVKTDE